MLSKELAVFCAEMSFPVPAQLENHTGITCYARLKLAAKVESLCLESRQRLNALSSLCFCAIRNGTAMKAERTAILPRPAKRHAITIGLDADGIARKIKTLLFNLTWHIIHMSRVTGSRPASTTRKISESQGS